VVADHDSVASNSDRFRGRNPTKRHDSLANPDATSAVSAADGPGSTSTARPAAIAVVTST
jgi:hypothetical protein